MPYGAHETMEMNEILMEKINMITHFNLYARQAQNPQLLDTIARHQQEEIRSYNELVSYTRDNNRFTPIWPNTDIRGISRQQIQYGLNNPAQFAPQSDAVLSDDEIAVAMLMCHKNAARNGMWATLECADPNLRRTLLNSAANCANQAYEVFLLMNGQGLYQVPTLSTQTEQEFLSRYQPASPAMEAQYAQMAGQYGVQQQSGYGAGGSASANMYGAGSGYANMSGAASGNANMSGAGSGSTNMFGAGSGNTNMYGDGSGYANMSGAGSGNANMSGAGSGSTSMSGGANANMSADGSGYANMSGAGSAYANAWGAGSGYANMSGAGSGMNGSLPTGSTQSVLYGDGQGI